MKTAAQISFLVLFVSFGAVADELGMGRTWEATKACDSAAREMQRKYEALVKQKTPPAAIDAATWQDAIGKDANKKNAACNALRLSLGLPLINQNDKNIPGQVPKDLRQGQNIRKVPTQPSVLEGLPKEVKPLIVEKLNSRDANALKNVNRATSDDASQAQRRTAAPAEAAVDAILECPKVADVKSLPVGRVKLSNLDWISMSSGDLAQQAKLSHLSSIEFLEGFYACIYKDDAGLLTRRMQRDWSKDPQKRTPDAQSCRLLNEKDADKVSSRAEKAGAQLVRARTVFEPRAPNTFIPEGIKFVCPQLMKKWR